MALAIYQFLWHCSAELNLVVNAVLIFIPVPYPNGTFTDNQNEMISNNLFFSRLCHFMKNRITKN